MTYTTRSAPTLFITAIAPTTGLAVATCHTVKFEVWLVLGLGRGMTVECALLFDNGRDGNYNSLG
jgi:hypothetical protein